MQLHAWNMESVEIEISSVQDCIFMWYIFKKKSCLLYANKPLHNHKLDCKIHPIVPTKVSNGGWRFPAYSVFSVRKVIWCKLCPEREGYACTVASV